MNRILKNCGVNFERRGIRKCDQYHELARSNPLCGFFQKAAGIALGHGWRRRCCWNCSRQSFFTKLLTRTYNGAIVPVFGIRL